MANAAAKDAQRRALADAVQEYKARGGAMPRCRMSKQHPKWMSITRKAPQRILRYSDLISNK